MFPVIEHWRKIKEGDINNILLLDECEFLDRKQKMISPQKTEDLIVAMGNTNGGIIISGYTDSKDPFPLKGSQRDGIQQQITNICRKNIQPSISPKFETIVFDNDSEFYLLIFQKRRKLFILLRMIER